MSEAQQFVTPVGRVVQGDCFKGSTKGYQGAEYKDSAGQPQMRWFIAIAVLKTDPGCQELMNLVTAKAIQDFPALFPNGQLNTPKFAWKIADGDQTPTKPGHAGCMIFKFGSTFAPPCYDNATPPQSIVDPNQIKRGFYVQIIGNTRGNDRTGDQAGMYLNIGAIQLVGYGDVIQSGPDGNSFTTPATLPPGCSATPVAGNAGISQGGGMPGQTNSNNNQAQPGGGMMGQPQGGAMPGQPQGGNVGQGHHQPNQNQGGNTVTPDYGIMNNNTDN